MRALRARVPIARRTEGLVQETALEPVLTSLRELYGFIPHSPGAAQEKRAYCVWCNAYGSPWAASRRGWIAIALLLRTFSLARTPFVRSRLGACARPRLRAAIVCVSTILLAYNEHSLPHAHPPGIWGVPISHLAPSSAPPGLHHLSLVGCVLPLLARSMTRTRWLGDWDSTPVAVTTIQSHSISVHGWRDRRPCP